MKSLKNWIEFTETSKKVDEKKEKEVSFKKSGLKEPAKADLNKNKKISGYEEARGSAIDKAMAKARAAIGKKKKK